MNFNSHVDVAVGVAVRLVNAATPGSARGRPYLVPEGPALDAAITAALPPGSKRAAMRSTRRAAFQQVAQSARPVFEQVEHGSRAEAASCVNALIARYRPTPLLESHDGQPWHLHFHGPREADPTSWGGPVAMGLATVLGSEYADRLGICAAPACDRVFVDVSRNGTRRFCSTTCQNRVKTAAHRARAT